MDFSIDNKGQATLDYASSLSRHYFETCSTLLENGVNCKIHEPQWPESGACLFLKLRDPRSD